MLGLLSDYCFDFFSFKLLKFGILNHNFPKTSKKLIISLLNFSQYFYLFIQKNAFKFPLKSIKNTFYLSDFPFKPNFFYSDK